MVKYVYYSPADNQIEGIFDTPVLSDQVDWVAKGYSRALVPEGKEITRDHRILTFAGDYIAVFVPSTNPVQPTAPQPTPLSILLEKLRDRAITLEEIADLLRLERGL